ncbi:MAG TPA: thiamine pyrophosphate-dependent enzyme, partial [Coriobacteriia bacterium]|nr:thiamine pyrophosphate-dependent enzyme [Coriobacteriia bacterium]
MSLDITRINPHFEDVMPREYKDLVENGPFGGDKTIGDLGTFKELLEEHPLCAGCNLALAFRLLMASLPRPEDTVVVGTTGCNSLAFTQLALHNVHSLFGNQNAVASGLKRGLALRFPDKVKDVVVIAGDGATADIGLDMTLHSWFRQEKIATVMFDNELYANTGGQESGMSLQGSVLNMAPTGKKFEKVKMAELAIASGCDYVAVVSTARPRQIGKSFEKAVLIAREVGPTYVQIHTPCPTNMKLKSHEGILAAKERLKTDYAFREHITPEAEEFLASHEAAKAS